MTESFLEGFSNGVDDYAAAMIDGTADQDEMVDLIHKYVYKDRERAKAAGSIINGTMRLSKGAALNVASVQDQLSWFQSEGLVSADITLDTLVDSSYVKTTSSYSHLCVGLRDWSYTFLRQNYGHQTGWHWSLLR